MTVGGVSSTQARRSSNLTGLLSLHSQGAQVTQLQQRLNTLGYNTGTPDGDFGPKTQAAVRSFQRDNNLPVDGTVGPRTRAAMDQAQTAPAQPTTPAQATAPAANLQRGSSGGAVRQLQTQLNGLGLNAGTADGRFGANTETAVKTLQARWNLPPDGEYGPKTRAALNKALSGQAAPNPNATAPVGGTGNVPGTVQESARQLLASPNVSFWSGLSSGSDRANMERLARGEQAYVPATGRYVTPNANMMQALVDMSKQGPIMINALTGGQHSSNSNHYRGTSVDLDVSTGNHTMIERIARQYGGERNYERDHIHLDF